jgi:uncharacterized protein YjbI with pentapeptide repeats
MGIKINGTSPRISQILDLLESIRRKNPTSLTAIKKIRRESAYEVARKYHVTIHTVQDKCQRQLGLASITDFDQLVWSWLNDSDSKLFNLLQKQTASINESTILSNFFNVSGINETTSSTKTISYRSITKEKLLEIIREHDLWLNTEGESGTKADFSGITLEGVELNGINIPQADLSSSNLEQAKLKNANLSYTNMVSTNLKSTELEAANLKGANLSNADLKEANLLNADITDVIWNNANLAKIKGIPDNKLREIKSKLIVRPLSGTIKASTEIGDVTIHDANEIGIASRIISDKPSAIDLLEFSDYAEAISDFVTNENTNMPLTLAIDAPWGGGKSTLMEMIQRIIDLKSEDKNKYITISFNAWKYEKEEALWAALALTILKSIRSNYGLIRKIVLWYRINWARFDKEIFFDSLA